MRESERERRYYDALVLERGAMKAHRPQNPLDRGAFFPQGSWQSDNAELCVYQSHKEAGLVAVFITSSRALLPGRAGQ